MADFHLSETNAARRIAWEMTQRRWSQERVAKEMTAAGHPVPQSAISKIVNPRTVDQRRAISVDELIGFAKVFTVPIVEMLQPLAAALNAEAARLVAELGELEARRADLSGDIAALRRRLAQMPGGEA